jgi:hypothetical protein
MIYLSKGTFQSYFLRVDAFRTFAISLVRKISVSLLICNITYYYRDGCLQWSLITNLHK